MEGRNGNRENGIGTSAFHRDQSKLNKGERERGSESENESVSESKSVSENSIERGSNT